MVLKRAAAKHKHTCGEAAACILGFRLFKFMCEPMLSPVPAQKCATIFERVLIRRGPHAGPDDPSGTQGCDNPLMQHATPHTFNQHVNQHLQPATKDTA